MCVQVVRSAGVFWWALPCGIPIPDWEGSGFLFSSQLAIPRSFDGELDLLVAGSSLGVYDYY